MVKRLVPLVAFLAMVATGAQANEFEPALREFAAKQVREWVKDPKLVEAIKAQNSKNGGLDEAQIVKLDKQWRAETGGSDRPLINQVLGNEVSSYLKAKKDASAGLVTEAFVMDNKGLNVGQSDVTSDYWQGDEAKWKQTYLVGADAVHISGVEQDESTQTFQSQVSVSVVDPADGKVIGAITVGVNVEMLSQ
jgi:hypothetical protein